MKVDDEDQSLVVLNFEQTVLNTLGIPQSFVQKFDVNNDFEQNDGLWKLEIQLLPSYKFNDELIKTKVTNSNHYTLTQNTFVFYFESPFNYIGLNLNTQDAQNYLQTFVNQIPLILSNGKLIFENNSGYLNSEYKWFIENSEYNKLANVFNNIKIENFKQQESKINTWTYDLNTSVQSPYVLLTTNNEIKQQESFNNLIYSQSDLDFNSINSVLTKQVEEFAEKTKSVNSQEQLDTLVSTYEQKLSESILKKSTGISFDLKQSQHQNNKSYSLTIFLPANYKITNITEQPSESDKEQMIAGYFNNSVQYTGLIETAITISDK